MTYKEAIGYIKRHWYIDAKVATLAISALEKHIPKKPQEDNGEYWCPCCDTYLFDDIADSVANKPNYCHNCGQAISWEDE